MRGVSPAPNYTALHSWYTASRQRIRFLGDVPGLASFPPRPPPPVSMGYAPHDPHFAWGDGSEGSGPPPFKVIIALSAKQVVEAMV